ncbi:MAG: glucokinase [Actinomycetia bacterium]|nr:glucokinase [Actinomycetes bacterium]
MHTIGFDIGGTKIAAAVVDASGRELSEARRDTPDTWAETSAALHSALTELLHACPDAAAVGVGIAGLVDRSGYLSYGPNLPGIEHVDVQGELSRLFPLPVVVDNDANVAAYGEAKHGAIRGVDDALVVTLGTGIGGGLIIGGEVYRGGHGFAAEIGHITIDLDGPVCACGERGHWEALASGNALGRMGREAASEGRVPSVLAQAGGVVAAITGHEVGQAAAAGAPDALALIDEYADLVAVGLASLANILDPSVIVISGGIINLGDVLMRPARKHFIARIEAGTERPVPELVAAELGERAGVIGAAALARRSVA